MIAYDLHANSGRRWIEFHRDNVLSVLTVIYVACTVFENHGKSIVQQSTLRAKRHFECTKVH